MLQQQQKQQQKDVCNKQNLIHLKMVPQKPMQR